MTTSNPHPPVATERPRVLTGLARRWPTALGVLFAADSLFGEVTDETVGTFAAVLMILPLVYLILAVAQRRRWTWPVLLVLVAIFIALRLQERVESSVVFLAVALGAAVWGAGRGRHRERDFQVQIAGMVGFGALALAGLAVDADLGRYLVAAGWLAHSAWDFVHLALDRVVSRSYAEWCGVFDVLIGTSLIVVPLL